ncbi:hypothetical protein HBN50_16020 [Halobacteriovorax sp. GB3]|uniref:hypothetical protein n=1 Tax=Halobacteriovorax sp. GB3 TaxID=2719615 RepID=UPI0023618B8F|nr:hypothetical protein [Halobacteriovorax sp. GB3]MDD0854620.1 hypothetical protein [Halobacteriovorax sp. GB3]
MLKKLISITVLFTLIFSVQANEKIARETIDQYDLRTYHPDKFALKDLTFEIRQEGLVESLNEGRALGKLSDVFVKVYWLTPGELKLEVNGLPNGFYELKNRIRMAVEPYLIYVIPQELQPRIRAYQLSAETVEGNVEVGGVDKTQKLNSSRIKFIFSNDGRLVKSISFSPSLVSTTDFTSTKKTWSRNKWVLESLASETIQGNRLVKVDTHIDYVNESGYGFPKKIEVNSETIAKFKDKKNKLQEKSLGKGKLILNFDNFQVNQGIAKRELMKGKN